MDPKDMRLLNQSFFRDIWTWLQSKKQIAIKIWKKKDWIWKSMEIIFQQKELL